MKRMTKTIIGLAASAAMLTACSSDADVASRNLAKGAEQFEIERRIVFVNGITDEYLLVIEGRCSFESGSADEGGSQVDVTCKIGPDEYKKHSMGLSDNVTYVAEQVEAADVSEYHYRVIFKPESLVPNIDLETSGDDS